MDGVKRATGCTIKAKDLEFDEVFDVTDFGAGVDKSAVDNTIAINAAISEASANGGTVVVPAGEYKCYTIRMQSNVNLHLKKGSVLYAARPDIDGGNYDEPEINRYVGLQDHGHTYFANSHVYGEGLKNIMISGHGRFDGSYLDEDGYTGYSLEGGDPLDCARRNMPGHDGIWFGNKGIALVDCENVVFKDFSIVYGGHFAIICEGVDNLLADGITVDTIRDAFDIDCCEDVTVRNSWFNSLTDDAIVLKSSFGLGRFKPTVNVLVDKCNVTGYDAGSVYNGTFTNDKLVSIDRGCPTARVKLGTETSCGFDLVTVSNIKFCHSRGFALEAVDCSPLTNVIFEDSVMEYVSSSPIFLRIGDRGRFPVTGNSAEELINAVDNVRLDKTSWVLPNAIDYDKYPAKRYTPSYNYGRRVTADGCNYFNIVSEDEPCRLNPANYMCEDGKYFLLKYDEELNEYKPDYDREIGEDELCLYANAVGADFATIENVYIENIVIKNSDPRYPISIMGLDGHPVKNVHIKNVKAEYRGGLLMEHAVEQRQINTGWEYAQYNARPSVQLIPWLSNNFFTKNEGLLPRLDWDDEKKCFVPSPYNVPELVYEYPEPEAFGVMPSYGIYARHAENLVLEDISLTTIVEDERPAMVFDDVTGSIMGTEGVAVFVDNNYKRPAGFEYVPNYPYHKTTCDIETDDNTEVVCSVVDAPAPGTPRDELYGFPTAAVTDNGYSYEVATDDYPLPLTVHRPYFIPVNDVYVSPGKLVCFDVMVRNPATDGTSEGIDMKVWNEGYLDEEYVVDCESGTLLVTADELPEGADFDVLAGNFIWTPEKEGTYSVTFKADDGVIPISMTVVIHVEDID